MSEHSDARAAVTLPPEDRSVRAVLEIDRGGACVMDSLEGNIVDVDVRFYEGSCQCDVTLDVGDDDEVFSQKHYQNTVCDHCPGVVFSSHGCLPRFVEAEDELFYIQTFAPDVGTIADLVEELRSVCERVRLVSLTSDQNGDIFSDSMELDISVLTPKQRETIERAIEAGYYDSSDGQTLSNLADEFGVSKSALSQRLARAEEKLLRQLL